jgi:hypothetical protein
MERIAVSCVIGRSGGFQPPTARRALEKRPSVGAVQKSDMRPLPIF